MKRKHYNFKVDGGLHISTGIILIIFLFTQIPFGKPLSTWNVFLMVLAAYGAVLNLTLGIINYFEL